MGVNYIIGNWKMSLGPDASIFLADKYRNNIKQNSNHKVAIAPDALAIKSIAELLTDSDILIFAQDCSSQYEYGPYTGELSIHGLKEIGVDGVIIGHSERRHLFNETYENINHKLNNAIMAELIPVLCVGETHEIRISGNTERDLDRQLKMSFKNIDFSKLKTDLLIAYEPVWAISTKNFQRIPNQIEIQEAVDLIYTWIIKNFSSLESKVKIIYGGSVNPENAKIISMTRRLEGFLVGGASLNVASFKGILEILD